MIAAGYLGFALIHLVHDKLIHFATFAILTAEFYFIFNTKAVKLLRLITLMICTLGASVLLEMIQHIVNPARVFDVKDIYCNVGGSIVGLLASIFAQDRRNELDDYVVVGMEDL